MRALRTAWTWISHGYAAWGLSREPWGAVVSTGPGVVTGSLASMAGGLAWGIFLGTGAFALSMLGLAAKARFLRTAAVFQHLTIPEVSVFDYGLQMNDDGVVTLTHFTMQCMLKNESEQTMFIRTKRAYHSFMAKIRPDANLPEYVAVLPRNTMQWLRLPTIRDCGAIAGKDSEQAQLKGRIELEIEYGSREDNLEYLLEYVSEPTATMGIDLNAKKAKMKLMVPIRTLRHKRRT